MNSAQPTPVFPSAPQGLSKYLLSWWPWRSSHTRKSWWSLDKEKTVFKISSGFLFLCFGPCSSELTGEFSWGLLELYLLGKLSNGRP